MLKRTIVLVIVACLVITAGAISALACTRFDNYSGYSVTGAISRGEGKNMVGSSNCVKQLKYETTPKCEVSGAQLKVWLSRYYGIGGSQVETFYSFMLNQGSRWHCYWDSGLTVNGLYTITVEPYNNYRSDKTRAPIYNSGSNSFYCPKP